MRTVICNVLRGNPFDALHYVGIIPDMLDPSDPRPVKEQLNEGYAHGGGWHATVVDFKLGEDDSLHYEGDPTLLPVVEIRVRHERILIYQHAWVAIIQPDRSYEVCRMD
jgi:hypothetical protein